MTIAWGPENKDRSDMNESITLCWLLVLPSSTQPTKRQTVVTCKNRPLMIILSSKPQEQYPLHTSF